MKKFPPKVEGPLGPWYRKLNAAIAAIQDGDSIGQLREVLREPDLVQRSTEKSRPSTHFESINAILRQGERQNPETIWGYADPYRPRVWYYFGIAADRVVGSWRETLSTEA